MSWLLETGPGRDDFERTFALRPNLFAAWRDASDAGLDETKITELGHWWQSPDFTDVERACLRFAEQFGVRRR